MADGQERIVDLMWKKNYMVQEQWPKMPFLSVFEFYDLADLWLQREFTQFV